MKKAILKGAVFGLTFFAALFIISSLMNRGNHDLTAEIAPAQFPVVYMGLDGNVYNELHGYIKAMNPAYMRDNVTALSEGRSTEFTIDTYGRSVNGISYEVRSVDGERLIENNQVTAYEEQGSQIFGKITLKDLIEKNTEYELIISLSTEQSNNIRYYTRVVWPQDYHLTEKLAFVQDFSEKTFDKEAVRELARYMEPNSMGDNSTLHRVDIHCSLNQVSWGSLPVYKVTEAVFDVIELAEQTASLKGHYIAATGEGKDSSYFYVEEYYRLRYTADRIYLLDYYRTMTGLLDAESDIYANDKILLGVADDALEIKESEDGNIFAFELQNRLFSYNVTTNKMAAIFGFYDTNNGDARTLYNQHGIQILNIDEGGNVQFVVYGYMNRGRHEGEVGIQVYSYESSVNTIEELLYIPYDKTYQILKSEIEQLLYLSKENYLYLMLGDMLYEINLAEKSCTPIVEIVQDESIRVSDSDKMVVWQKGGLYNSEELVLMDLGNREQISVKAGDEQYIMPLGFMGEDLIYGLAHKEDVTVDAAGRTSFPMYAVVIRNASGRVLKTYSQEGLYVQSCIVQKNQITLERVKKLEDGSFAETEADHIMNNAEITAGKNVVKTVITENYGKFVQIAVKKNIDTNTLQVLNPKEVLYEGGRNLLLANEEAVNHYYVYSLEGVIGAYREPAKAVIQAEQSAGMVLNESGDIIWAKGNRVAKNQIMAIKEVSVTEDKNSLMLCLDTILRYEGMIRNVEYLLSMGKNVYTILEENLEDAEVLDLKGCSLDAVLYYVNQDIPVFVPLQDGNAVLITGFNQYNIVVLDTAKGNA